jgi:hypothetical protein
VSRYRYFTEQSEKPSPVSAAVPASASPGAGSTLSCRDPRQHFRPVALGYQQRVSIATFRRRGASQDRPTW